MTRWTLSPLAAGEPGGFFLDISLPFFLLSMLFPLWKRKIRTGQKEKNLDIGTGNHFQYNYSAP